MKVTDFKIGDLVNFGGEKAKVMSTSFIDKNSIAVQYLDGDKGIWGANLLDEIDGIPLTEEILEKNGWKKYYENEWTNPNFANLHASFINEGEWVITIRNGETVDNVLTDIRYVHELQHILWVIGEDDNLTI